MSKRSIKWSRLASPKKNMDIFGFEINHEIFSEIVYGDIILILNDSEKFRC